MSGRTMTSASTALTAPTASSSSRIGGSGSGRSSNGDRLVISQSPLVEEDVTRIFRENVKGSYNEYLTLAQVEQVIKSETTLFAQDLPKQVRRLAFRFSNKSTMERLNLRDFTKFCTHFLPVCASIFNVFTEVDQDRSGKIDFKEFRRGRQLLLGPLDNNPNQSDDMSVLSGGTLGRPVTTLSIFREIDTNRSGKINFEEFATYYKDHCTLLPPTITALADHHQFTNQYLQGNEDDDDDDDIGDDIDSNASNDDNNQIDYVDDNGDGLEMLDEIITTATSSSSRMSQPQTSARPKIPQSASSTRSVSSARSVSTRSTTATPIAGTANRNKPSTKVRTQPPKPPSSSPKINPGTTTPITTSTSIAPAPTKSREAPSSAQSNKKKKGNLFGCCFGPSVLGAVDDGAINPHSPQEV